LSGAFRGVNGISPIVLFVSQSGYMERWIERGRLVQQMDWANRQGLPEYLPSVQAF
jgi:hypothetical protein